MVSGAAARRTPLLERRISRDQLTIGIAYILLMGTGLAWLAGSSTGAFALSLLLMAVAAASRTETCCELLFVCFPFFNVMGWELGGTSLYYVLILLAVVKAALHGKIDHGKTRALLYLVVILLTVYNAFAGLSYARWLLHLLVPVLLVGSGRMKARFPRYLGLLTVSMVISSVIGLMMVNSGIYLYGGDVWTNGEHVSRFSGLIGDPVFFGQVSSVIVGANAFLVYIDRSYRFSVPLSIALAFFDLLAYSKAGLFSLGIVAVFIVVAFVYKTVRRGLPVRNFVMLIVAIFLTYYGAQYLMSGSSLFSVDAMTTRLDSSDLLTGRTQIWQGYFSLWQSIGVPMVFKGIGFDTYASTYVWSTFNKCHNLYIETVTLFGVLGAALIFVSLGAYMVKRARGGATLMTFLPCIVLLVTGLILHGYLDFPFFYEWTVALGCLDYATGLSHRGLKGEESIQHDQRRLEQSSATQKGMRGSNRARMGD